MSVRTAQRSGAGTPAVGSSLRDALRGSRLTVRAAISIDDAQAWAGVEQLVHRETHPGCRWVAHARGSTDALDYLVAVAGCPEVRPTPMAPGMFGHAHDRATATFALHAAAEALTILEDGVARATRLVVLVENHDLRTALSLLRDGDTNAALGLARLALLRNGSAPELVVAEAPPDASPPRGGDEAPPVETQTRIQDRIRSELRRPLIMGLLAATVAIVASGLALAIAHTRTTQSTAGGPGGANHQSTPALNTSVALYDSHTGRILLVGCCDRGRDGVARVTTWASDGSGWRHLTLATAPEWRQSPGFATDPSSGNLLLQGGTGHHDTWSWNGISWTELHPPTAPRDGPLWMVTDAATGTVVALDAAAAPRADGTWSWNGTTWTHLATEPPARGPFTYDPGSRRVIAVVDAPTGAPDEQTWAFDGTTWARVPTPDVVPVEYFAIAGGIPDQMAPDYATGGVVYLEQPGLNPGYVIPGDTYLWTAGEWTHADSPTPLESQGLLVAGGPARHPFLVAPVDTGGDAEIWRWTGTQWEAPRS